MIRQKRHISITHKLRYFRRLRSKTAHHAQAGAMTSFPEHRVQYEQTGIF